VFKSEWKPDAANDIFLRSFRLHPFSMTIDPFKDLTNETAMSIVKTAASCRNRWVVLWVAAMAAAGLRVFRLDDKVASTTKSTTGPSDLPTRPESQPATLALWHANTTNSSFHGYDSLEQLHGRSKRFPSVDQRVRVYMSNWYEPASTATADCGNDDDDDDDKVMLNHTNRHVVLYRWIPGDQVVVQEVWANATEDEAAVPSPQQRQFLIDAQTTLGKLHFLDERNMRPDQCDSEYCVDVIQYLLPALRRVAVDTTTAMVVPVLFQFSDEETSRAFAIQSHSNETYPAVPHFKKSRLSLLHPVTSLNDDDDRSQVTFRHRPLPLPAVSAQDAKTTPHFHPST
jgi:hypothetical protein